MLPTRAAGGIPTKGETFEGESSLTGSSGGVSAGEVSCEGSLVGVDLK